MCPWCNLLYVAATRFRPEQSTATVVHGEALDVLRALPDGCAGLVYVDPPFNTGEFRTGHQTTATEDASASRLGFAGRHYRVEQQSGATYADSFDDYIGWLRPRIEETRRILARHGTLYFHIDPRESHYCKVLLDEIFGRASFLNEVVWAYDYGARTKRRWPAKHDVILVYVKDPRDVSLRRVRGRARAVHGAEAADAGACSAWQAAHRCLVAHDRPDVVSGTHRVSDAETTRHPAPRRGSVIASG